MSSIASPIPEGICQCGCGQRTAIAAENRKDRGYVKGRPLAWIKGHCSRRRIVNPGPIVEPNRSGLCLCGCGQKAPIARQTDTRRGILKGHHFPYLPNHHPHSRKPHRPHRRRKTAMERFLEKVDKTSSPHGCWLWTAGTTTGGYGKFFFQGRQQDAHRVAWQLADGPIPHGKQVCHDCDRYYPVGDTTYRRCARRSHLFLGTQQENVDDCKRKGRGVGKRRPVA